MFSLSSHTYPRKESYLLLRSLPIPALLYSALSSYRDRWLREEEKSQHIQNQQCGGIINASIHLSIHSSSQPASQISWLSAQHCAVKNMFLCGNHDTWPPGIFLQVRNRWETHLPILTTPLHLSNSASPQTSFSKVIFLKYEHVTLLPKCPALTPQWPQEKGWAP